MRSFAFVGLCLIVAADASAQQKNRTVLPFMPESAINREYALMLEPAGRYLLRQIDLRPDQVGHAEAALKTVYADAEPIPEEQLLEITDRLDKALRRAFRARMYTVTAELYATHGHAARLDTLARELAPHLDVAQQARLADARKRLFQNPTGAVRPIDLYRIVQQFALTEEQQRDIIAAHGGLRKQIGPLMRFDPERRVFFLNFFAERVQRLLTPEQRNELARRARALRADLLEEGLTVPPPPYDDQVLVTGTPAADEDEAEEPSDESGATATPMPTAEDPESS